MGGHHIEAAFVVPDCGCIDSVAAVEAGKVNLGIAGQTRTDLLPIDKVLAVIDRYSWKILEGTVYKIIIFADATDAGICMESWKYRIAICAQYGTDETCQYDNKYFLHSKGL